MKRGQLAEAESPGNPPASYVSQRSQPLRAGCALHVGVKPSEVRWSPESEDPQDSAWGPARVRTRHTQPPAPATAGPPRVTGLEPTFKDPF